jgi:hypothetical protein
MNFFTLIQNLLFKPVKKDDVTAEEIQLFVPFMINRWLSFSDKSKAVFVNHTLNKFSGLFDDKVELYKLYDNLIPKSRFKRIQYVKKVKKDEEAKTEDELLFIQAKNNCLSTRELKMYMALSETACK